MIYLYNLLKIKLSWKSTGIMVNDRFISWFLIIYNRDANHTGNYTGNGNGTDNCIIKDTCRQ